MLGILLMDSRIHLVFLATLISGIAGQLIVDFNNLTLGAQAGTPPQATNIISDGKLCDPNVQQHSGYINFSDELGEKSYFFWLLESRSTPATDPLVVWLTGGQVYI